MYLIQLRNDERLCRIPLNYLLGCLYTNFTLLWGPLQTLVAGYGNGLKRDLFWGVYGAKLRAADADIMRFLQQVKARSFVQDEVAANRVDFMKVDCFHFLGTLKKAFTTR